jgi:cyclic-di-GMP-binding biofilm dispersal mediator protein
MTAIAPSRALVLGATGGLGRAVVAELVAAGSQVVTSARSLHGPEGAVAHVAGDIAVAYDRERVVDAAIESLGGLDVVVIASGVVGFGALELTRSDDLDRLIAVDLTGPLALCALVAPMMDEGGVIVVVTGAVVDTPMLGTGAYAAAKAGLSVGIGVMAREWRRRGVRIIDARPPHTETGLSDRPMFGQAPRLGAGLTPSAVAATIVAAIAGDATVLEPAAFAGDQ